MPARAAFTSPIDQRAGEALLQGHGTGVAVPDLREVPAQLAQGQLVGRRQCSGCVLQRVEFLGDALLLFELGIPALLEDFAHQTVAGFGVVVLREGALGLVARLLQLPLATHDGLSRAARRVRAAAVRRARGAAHRPCRRRWRHPAVPPRAAPPPARLSSSGKGEREGLITRLLLHRSRCSRNVRRKRGNLLVAQFAVV